MVIYVSDLSSQVAEQIIASQDGVNSKLAKYFIVLSTKNESWVTRDAEAS
jgi:hypothetical protein